MLALRASQQFASHICNASVTGDSRTVSSTAMQHLGKLQPHSTALLMCDIQERFRTNIFKMESVIDGSIRLCKGAAALDIPVIVTEQYPKALGHTVEELAAVLPKGSLVVEKTKFSMAVDEVSQRLHSCPEVKHLLITGLEAHVCVMQTALDFIGQGYVVHVITDAVSSQRSGDRNIALKRLSQAGALLSTQEMALFQLAGDSQHPAFKTISALVKEARPESLL